MKDFGDDVTHVIVLQLLFGCTTSSMCSAMYAGASRARRPQDFELLPWGSCGRASACVCDAVTIGAVTIGADCNAPHVHHFYFHERRQGCWIVTCDWLAACSAGAFARPCTVFHRDYGCLLACDCFAAGKQHVPEETFEVEGDFAARDPLLLVSNVVLQGTISSSVFK